MESRAPTQAEWGTDKGDSPTARRILFCRAPGLLAKCARHAEGYPENAPVAVAEGRHVRDACPFAVFRGVHTGQAMTQARRLCPALLVVPLEALSPQPLSAPFLDLLADLSPVVEPEGPDAAFADMTGIPVNMLRLGEKVCAVSGFSSVIGVGPSRLAARACAECGLPPHRLKEADTLWLWPEDIKVVGRLKRLGLDTFSQVAALREEDLFYQFGRIGRLLHRRAQGQDLTTVRALYPPPRVDFRLDFAEFPLEDRGVLQAALATAAHEISERLQVLGQFGRRLVLQVTTEREGLRREELRREWTLPAPLQDAPALTRAANRLLMQMPLLAPVTALRLLVEELEAPKAATADLFAGRLHRDTLALEAVRGMLAARYGPQALRLLSQRPQSVREKRRAMDQEARL